MVNEAKKSYISVAELAKILGISRVAVFKRIKKGQIPAEKIGRAYIIDAAEVAKIAGKNGQISLTEEKKAVIKKAVEKVVEEYGETLKLLGKE